ncbi:MAG: hypothetical protein SFW36_22835 [Leptolyngbyaceae cyanobacterium bins.59]|nr:hypothetical protein [Leptolyngbyaceae cyanobacterium bins.59]
MIQIHYHGRLIRAVVEGQSWTYQIWSQEADQPFPLHTGCQFFLTPDQALEAGMLDVDTRLVRLSLIKPLCAIHRAGNLTSNEVSKLLDSVCIPSRLPHGFTRQIAEW